MITDPETFEQYIFNGASLQPLRGREIAHAVQTASGLFFWPMEAHPSEVVVKDVAKGIARECRYGNQAPYFYSVAWHSYCLSLVVPPHLARWALVHDATEAYLKDIPRPLKRQEPFKSTYVKIEDALMAVCAEAFGLESTTMPYDLKEHDTMMSRIEMMLFAEDAPVYEAKLRGFGHSAIMVDAWRNHEWIPLLRRCPRVEHATQAEAIWLGRYKELWPETNSTPTS